jgi:S-DNA-T family DNA segregation ATPase FtsK/SpoIIIE
VGRAQGINLILASQRPKGVTDQMRANIKLRICMRVEQVDTSREMLRRSDAAFLPNGMPGRGYLQVGNENMELIQVSYTGEAQPDDRPAAAEWPDRPARPAPTGDDIPRLFDAVVNISRELVDNRMAPKPWPGFLPEVFSLQSELVDAQRNRTYTLTTAVTDWLNGDTDGLWPGIDWRTQAMRPVVGLLDNPAEARQEPLRFDLSRSHLIIMGDTGWGRTSMLRTVAVDLVTTHSPNELHVYVLDLGGRNFRNLEEVPHVGAVLYADDETYDERLNRLLHRLNRMVDERQQLLSNADSASLYDYNQRHPAQPLPAVLVLIDNFAELYENYELLVDTLVVPLVRRSLSVGISFVVSANVPNNMSSKLYNLFGERVTLKQSNPDRYMDIVGRGAVELDDIPGRGYIKVGRRPLLFHAALPLGLFDADGRDTLSEGDEIRLMAHTMRRALLAGTPEWVNKPDPIRILPELVDLDEMIKEAGPVAARRLQAVLGQNANLQPALVDLKRLGPHFIVTGPPLSGKSTVLYNWVFSLGWRYGPEQVAFVLIDMQRRFEDYGGERRLSELPHVLAVITAPEEMEALLPHLKTEAEALAEQATNRELFVIIDNFDDFAEELEKNRDAQRDLATLASRFGRDGLHFVIVSSMDSAGSDLRRRIQSANYGIGLRTEQAVGALRVQRLPPALRGRELPLARGFLVKSGQPALIQVASPYSKLDPAIDDPEAEDEQVAQSLDDWVKRITRRYPEQKAAWSSGVEVAAPGESMGGLSPGSMRMVTVLQNYARYEMEHLDEQEPNGGGPLVTARLLELGVEAWGKEEALAPLLNDVWKKTSGLSDDMAEMMLDTMDTDSILLAVEDAVNNLNGQQGEEE